MTSDFHNGLKFGKISKSSTRKCNNKEMKIKTLIRAVGREGAMGASAALHALEGSA